MDPKTQIIQQLQRERDELERQQQQQQDQQSQLLHEEDEDEAIDEEILTEMESFKKGVLNLCRNGQDYSNNFDEDYNLYYKKIKAVSLKLVHLLQLLERQYFDKQVISDYSSSVKNIAQLMYDLVVVVVVVVVVAVLLLLLMMPISSLVSLV